MRELGQIRLVMPASSFPFQCVMSCRYANRRFSLFAHPFILMFDENVRMN